MSKYYCTRAFNHMQVMDNGNVLPCCPPWIDHYVIGNIKTESAEEVWNGEKARKFRESIFDGSFRYCNVKSCPHLAKKTGPVVEHKQIKSLESKEIIIDLEQNKTILDHGPHEIEFAYDRSCNLSCPSCRRKVIIVSGEEKEEALELQKKLQNNFFKDAQIFNITSSGDAFASPIFRKLLQTLEKNDAPNLESLIILTNGLLVKRYWHTVSDYLKTISIKISISVDAVKEETYLINRRGGTWEGIHENLEFVGELKKSEEIHDFQTSFVVQQNNFKEMKDFVKMSEDYGANYIQFQIIEPDFIRDLHYKDYLDEWAGKAVQEKRHPQHEEFLTVLKDEFFDRYPAVLTDNESLPIVDLGQLRSLRDGVDISQYEENLKEYKEKVEKSKKIKLAKIGVLKDIWFENEIHFVKMKSVKSVNGADVAKLDNGKTVKWDKDKWVEI